MKANELRIGNWIDVKMLNGSRNITRTQFHFDLERYCHLLIPIPLTPEILCRIKGFKKAEHGEAFWIRIDDNKSLVLEFINGGIRVCINTAAKTSSGFWGPVFLGIVNYLHQLQNLIFALTGGELQIEL